MHLFELSTYSVFKFVQLIKRYPPGTSPLQGHNAAIELSVVSVFQQSPNR